LPGTSLLVGDAEGWQALEAVESKTLEEGVGRPVEYRPSQAVAAPNFQDKLLRD
jgi:hypothetical protein